MGNRTGVWAALIAGSAGLLVLDFVTGPYITFPITFVIPVALASWFLGLRQSVGFALGLVACQFALELTLAGGRPSLVHLAINEVIRLGVLLLLAVLVERVIHQHRELARRVRVLEGVLPICAHCRQIRRADGGWESLEVYISERSDTKFSHGLCDTCAMTHYPEVFGTVSSRTVADRDPEGPVPT